LDDSNVSAWIYRGIAFYRLSKYEEALASFEEASDIDRSDPAAWHFIGEALHKLGCNIESDDAFAKAKELGWQWEIAIH
jgi:tetratricopeptide (TPR) repeat protein